MSIIEQFLRIIAPHHCLGCGREGHILCVVCAKGLQRPALRCYRCAAVAESALCGVCAPKAGVAGVLTLARYDGLAKEVVHQLKFDRASAAADDIAAALVAQFNLSTHGNAITYVPTAPARMRTRGYDQAALIAKAAARRAGLPFYQLLGRSSGNRQVGQNRAARTQQMQQAFYIRKPHLIAKRSIILVDDVLTTGSTCEAATVELLKAGAASVVLLTFAAAPPPGA